MELLAREYKNRELLQEAIPYNASLTPHLLLKKYTKFLVLLQYALRRLLFDETTGGKRNFDVSSAYKLILEKFNVKEGSNVGNLKRHITDHEKFATTSVREHSLPVAFVYYLKFYASSKQLKFKDIGRRFQSNRSLFKKLYTPDRLEKNENVLRQLMVCTHMKDVQKFVDVTYPEIIETSEEEEAAFLHRLRALIRSYERTKLEIEKGDKKWAKNNACKQDEPDILMLQLRCGEREQVSSYLRIALETLKKAFTLKERNALMRDLVSVRELISLSISTIQNEEDKDSASDTENEGEKDTQSYIKIHKRKIHKDGRFAQKNIKKQTSQTFTRNKQGRFQSKLQMLKNATNLSGSINTNKRKISFSEESSTEESCKKNANKDKIRCTIKKIIESNDGGDDGDGERSSTASTVILPLSVAAMAATSFSTSDEEGRTASSMAIDTMLDFSRQNLRFTSTPEDRSKSCKNMAPTSLSHAYENTSDAKGKQSSQQDSYDSHRSENEKKKGRKGNSYESHVTKRRRLYRTSDAPEIIEIDDEYSNIE